MKKNQIISLTCILYIFCSVSCINTSKPHSGEWQGEGISFTVCETGDTITQLNVVIPHGDEYLAQMYYSLSIKQGSFESHRDGIPYLGIPEANLEGKFVSRKMAKGTFNGIEWAAVPITNNRE
jgi:hypothetical protein